MKNRRRVVRACLFILAIVSLGVGTLYVYVDHASVGAVRPCSLPAQALLAKYAGTGAYTDCYELDVVGAVSRAELVEAFYTGKVFKVELFVVRLFYPNAGMQVEDRNAEQLLLHDMGSGRIRSWFMVAPQSGAPTTTTRLYFGTAVLPVAISETGEPRMGKRFAPLLRLHKFYSQVLLDGARVRLAQRT